MGGREEREKERRNIENHVKQLFILCVFLELDAATEQVTVELRDITEDQSNSDSEGNQCK